jgi:hypothetical protein
VNGGEGGGGLVGAGWGRWWGVGGASYVLFSESTVMYRYFSVLKHCTARVSLHGFFVDHFFRYHGHLNVFGW